MKLEGYIIEKKNKNIYKDGRVLEYWDKWNKRVYRDLEAAKNAWDNFPRCYKEFPNFSQPKCRIIPVYRGEIECELDIEGNIINESKIVQ